MYLFSKNILLTLLTISGLLLLHGCQPDEPAPTPLIQAKVSPGSGNTTNIFTIDLRQSESRIGRGTKVFTRWDWNADGIWDTPFTRKLVYEHRFYSPGNWKPIIEMTNLDGSSDTLSLSIPVVRGYSAPKPLFKVTPTVGHIYTPFVFDATGTHDDEDSLDLLEFRWDFDGDDIWEIPFGDSIRVTHVYKETGLYEIQMQVKDPTGLITERKLQVPVTLVDPRIQVIFNTLPDSITNNTPIIMDASASTDLDHPDSPLWYRWDWTNDRIWDTEWLSDPQTIHIFEQEYFWFVRLQVMSERGLTNDYVARLRVYHKNENPRAMFTSSTLAGNVNTNFRFDCWSTRDMESSPSQLLYRWDFDGDGQWDSEFKNEVITMHQFDKPGAFNTTLEAKDPLGGTDTVSKLIHVSTGTNTTDIFYDRRGVQPQYYGTVLIGDQWWFTRNMSIHDTTRYMQFFYDTKYENYYDYGNLYWYQYIGQICPPGWRVPSREDWNELFSNYPEEQLIDALLPGGGSDFSLVLAGMGIGFGPVGGTYEKMDRYCYYWSTSKPAQGPSPSVWCISFDKPNRKILRGYHDSPGKKYSVRCVKDR
jgi:uncharacterized protein (TIGR02145 family)